MTDVFSTEKRSWIMSQVRGQDTTPEIKVRSMIHRLGYRFRLHRKDLPGNPDLVFPSRKKIIFVHGCFWHGHNCSRGGRIPKANTDYWSNKLRRNIERDRRSQEALRSLGWEILIIWECDLKNPNKVISSVNRYLSTRARE